MTTTMTETEKEAAREECALSLMDSMRDAIGRLFLSVEPRLKQLYDQGYTSPSSASSSSYSSSSSASKGSDEGEAAGGTRAQ